MPGSQNPQLVLAKPPLAGYTAAASSRAEPFGAFVSGLSVACFSVGREAGWILYVAHYQEGLP